MCTLSYLPLENGFIFTSNRDERKARARAIAPQLYSIHGSQVVYPKDPEAGGTWLAVSESGIAICLLNGAKEKHISNPPYRQSRGLLLLDFWKYADPQNFLENTDFDGIEPFTLVVAQIGKCETIRWNGQNTEFEVKDSKKPAIWSSATLYSPEVIKERENWFQEWLKNQTSFETNSILDFHRLGGKGDPGNHLVMSRSDQKSTLSISSVSVQSENIEFHYQDLLALTYSSIQIPLLQTT
jgi:uncharacterized protein with NRDE domain